MVRKYDGNTGLKSEYKMLVFLSGALLVIGLFLPWFDFLMKVSAFGLIMEFASKDTILFTLAIPLCIGLISIYVTINKENPRIFGFLSLATLLYVTYLVIAGSNKLGIRANDIGDVIQIATNVLGIGFYMTLSGLFLLAFIGLNCSNEVIAEEKIEENKKTRADNIEIIENNSKILEGHSKKYEDERGLLG